MAEKVEESDGDSISFDRRLVLKGAGLAGLASIGSTSIATAKSVSTESDTPFDPIEATIADVTAAIVTEQTTARSIVDQYLDRIEAYGDELGAIITLNSEATSRADQLDEEFAKSGPVGPLHGVPVILKDNYDTDDLPTTAGSTILENSTPPDDAFLVSQIRDAGGIVLAKANMGEFAYGDNSSVGGQARNPYALDRTPGGSSAGTGAGLAANLSVVGTGSDTGGSVVFPAAANNLVGIRPTIGLLSRDGIVPLSETQDTGGPMARTVSDAAALLDVMAGYDPADPVTARGIGNTPKEGYTSFLNSDGLDGARIGVITSLIGAESDASQSARQDAEQVSTVVAQALEDMENAGASVTEVDLSSIMELAEEATVSTFEIERDLNAYLETRDDASVQTLDGFLESGEGTSRVREYLRPAAAIDSDNLENNVDYLRALSKRSDLRELILSTLADSDLDVLTYPTTSRTPAVIGEGSFVRGINTSITPAAGFASISVPAGFTNKMALPVGIELLGRPFSETRLIELAYSYEQATMQRRPPEDFGRL